MYYIGEQYTAADSPGGTWILVAILQDDVVVLRYETVASESNWSGTEGFVLCNAASSDPDIWSWPGAKDGVLVDGTDNKYLRK